MPVAYQIQLDTDEQREAYAAGLRPLTLPCDPGDGFLDRVEADLRRLPTDIVRMRRVAAANGQVEIWRANMMVAED